MPATSSPELILRPYQQGIVDAALQSIDDGQTRMLAVAATGTGKTATFTGVIRALADDPGETFLILAHRREILDQIIDTVRWVMPWISASVHSGEQRAVQGSRVVAASVQSLGRSETSEVVQWLAPSLVIVDEAHHAVADTYQRVFRDAGCYDGGASLLGVTATPARLDNKALVGSCERAIFERVIYRYDIADAVRDGWLVDLRGFTARADTLDLSRVKTRGGDYLAGQLEQVMDAEPVTELAIDSWRQRAAGRQTIVFCAGVDHALHVAAAFRSAGVAAEAVYGEMPMREREAVIARFRSGDTQVLTNVDILTEGFDARECACVVLLRPTKSWSLFAQMVGRGLRPLPGTVEHAPDAAARRAAIAASAKSDCIIIDISGNTAEHALAERHDGTGVPSLQALVGLPETLDIEARSIVEAVDEFDALPEQTKARAFRGRVSLSGLSAVLTEIALIDEVRVPQAMIDGGARLRWVQTGDLAYVISFAGSSEIVRRVELVGDMLGNWRLDYQSRERKTNRVCESKTYDIDGTHASPPWTIAERIIERNYVGVSNIAAIDSRWQLAPVTDAQIGVLMRRGFSREALAGISRGDASALITKGVTARG
jgi:superfamily II DNA or RNA helicase